MDKQSVQTNRVLKEILASYVNAHQNDWDSWLPLVQFAMNNIWQESIRTTPSVLNFGEHPVLPSVVHLQSRATASADLSKYIADNVHQARAALASAQQRQRQQANRRRRIACHSVGDLVMHSEPQLQGFVGVS
jgi:hypothetical protein